MRKLIVITGLLVAGIVVALLFRLQDTIPSHLDRLVHLRARKMPPSDIKGYFRRETLTWYLRGRPSTQRQAEIETQALIRLGYFEQREFTLQHRLLDRQFLDELNLAFSTNPSVKTNYRAMACDLPTRKIRVTTPKDCMPICENIIVELDRKAE